MTNIGTVIDGKYEILKEIGRGGMSIVYLAMDKRLNKQWAVKEIRKKGSGKNDEIVVNSLLAEANMMKRLDHPSLPRIVDIIDNGITIYVVMDYIEGESLDKILAEYGAQPEDKVIGWAKQLCDALGYLHSQKPPIIYRDMKPANVMLKPEGNIKIIDFGIAREYKEQSLADTTVLGTKGYAPPEQYSGQTDARSDIYALGMTMHHLLTGVDPRSGEAYAPVRQWNPELSEGIEAIIDKCVEPAAENRYQSCADLLYDLDHPDLITKGYKKKQKRRLYTFVVSAALCIFMTVLGISFNLASTHVNNSDYDLKINSMNPTDYYEAISIYPQRVDAYNKLIDYYKNHEVTNDDVKKIGNSIEANANSLDITDPAIADLYYDMGKLFFSEKTGNFKTKAVDAGKFFKIATESDAYFEKKEIAACYYSICRFMTNQSTTAEHALKDYEALFSEINSSLDIVAKADDSESNYDKISLYYVTMLLINNQAEYMAGVGFDKEIALNMLKELYDNSIGITSTLPYVNDLIERISSDYSDFVDQLNTKYNEVEKRQQSGTRGGN